MIEIMVKDRPTLRMIAKRVGVSHVTVSLALRNDRSIPETTAKRVRAAAEAMGYRRDPDVSRLMARIRENRQAGYQGVIVWLTAWPTRDGWRRWLIEERAFAGAKSRAADFGYQLEEVWYFEPGVSPRRLTSILKARGIEGILVAPLPDGLTSLDCEWSEFSCVAIGSSLHEPRLNRATSADGLNLELALEELDRRGFDRPGLLLSWGMDERVSHAWSGTYLSNQLRRRKPHRVPLLSAKSISRSAFRKWFITHRPNAVISNEYEVIEWLGELGLTVPKDVGHVRLDTNSLESKINGHWKLPSSTRNSGIDQLPEAIGAAGIDAVVGQLHRNERGIPAHPKLILVQGCWINGITLSKKPNAGGAGIKASIQRASTLAGRRPTGE